MAVTGFLYGKMFLSVFNAEIDWIADTIKVALSTVSETPSQDDDDYFDDVSNEVVGTGYTAGGETLGSKTITYTGGTNKVALDGADTVWSASTITARNAHVYDATPGTDATRPLIAFQDFGADVISTAGDFTIAWNAAGIVEITVS